MMLIVGGLCWSILSPCAAAAAATAGARSDLITQYFEWPMFGQNWGNTASGLTFAINRQNVGKLKAKWIFTTNGDVSARAAVAHGGVYFPDWSGYFYRLNASTGRPVWSRNLVTDYGLKPRAGALEVVSRTSPAVDGSVVYLGTQATANGAYLLAINTRDGSLRWKTQLDSNLLSIDTASPVVFEGVIYLGIASLEEGAAANPNYPCCSSRGSVLAIRAETGTIVWKHYTVPTGYSGGSVWGSALVPDALRGVVYATTGNNFHAPTDPAFVKCVAGSVSEAQYTSCLSSDDHVDSVLALDMSNGDVRWSHRLWTADDWNVACSVGFAAGQGNCPNPQGPDFDFGSGANLFVTLTSHGLRQMLGAGQKAGIYSALNPNTGKLLWATQVGPGSSPGGMQWGSATDGKRIYVSIANLNSIPYAAGSAGSWSALDPATGRILWQTPDPNGSIDLAPLTVANGVVYGASMAGAPQSRNMFALDARTGAILWSYPAGGSVIAGASIVNDTVYWGSGYSNLPIPGFKGNNKFYAFSVNGR
jgi:polyvinyl alcohol dehydrogenase (cytochrome)